MKLTILGGGGVRAPLFVASALQRAKSIHLDEICLMDIDANKLNLIGTLCRQIAVFLGVPVRISITTNPDEALAGASYVVTTIRVGFEAGRVLDETLALDLGVLGQETTGPGGFAMAMRSIPAILDYAKLAERLCPNAWIFNFTNPAGLVTQALHVRGYQKVVGICDGANLAMNETAKWLGIPPSRIKTEVFGLNHLSWTRHVWVDGLDILPELLGNHEFIAQSSMRYFDNDLIQQMGTYLNEYLYYYYYPEVAVEKIRSEPKTRGMEVLELNMGLLDLLQSIDIVHHPEDAIRAYTYYENRRNSSYMQFACPDNPPDEIMSGQDMSADLFLSREAAGYAGVALDIMSALENNTELCIALNVPNSDAIEGYGPDDVVEVNCRILNGRVDPISMLNIPVFARNLMDQVKAYERMAIEAIFERSRKKAIFALMAHPLVLSYPKSTRLIDRYLQAHREYIGDWK